MAGGGAGWGLGMSVAVERTRPWLTPGRFGWNGGYGTTAYRVSGSRFSRSGGGGDTRPGPWPRCRRIPCCTSDASDFEWYPETANRSLLPDRIA